MAVLLKTIISKLDLYDYKILTDKVGLSNTIKWVNIVETEEIAGFLEPFELAFITGVAISNDDEFLSLIIKIKEKNACGAVINLGPYIEKIPQKVLEFCKNNNFCLITMPWSVRLANVMRTITYEILQATRKNIELEVLLKDAILYPKREELYLNDLENQSFNVNGDFVVIAIDICNKNEELDEKTMNFFISFAKSICSGYDNINFLVIEGRIIAVLNNFSRQQIDSFIKFLSEQFLKCFKNEEKIYFCIGNIVNSIKNAHKSYINAKKTQKIYKAIYEKIFVVYYDEIGIYKLFVNIKDEEIIKEIYFETIKPIIDYDLYNNSDLFSVIKAYLDANGSVRAVAEEMFVHRNTVNYKLSKISEILNVNLSTTDVRTNLRLGIISYYYLKSF